jgi:MoaA/NifB/PqqE/SkfB family radical SAM enzyme
MEELNIIKDDLDRVGCGFCLAKWTQVTMHLQNGTNHSCHHPGVHKIPLEEIEQNPKALHNTKFKKLRRREMLTGKRPEECEYCWNIEDNSDQFSDRIYKSSEPWSQPHYQDIIQARWNEDFNPRYVEVSFSNTCNFKCSYCGPMYSSQWLQELKKHGDYPNSREFNTIKNQSNQPFLHSEHNPYVEAFWSWWPELYNDLDNFRITGGEPLLSKDTWKVLDYMLEQKNPNRKLKFAINTNLGVEDNLIDRLIEKLDRIINEDRVEEVILFTSIDAYGKHAEYIRNGLDTERFWNNIDKILTKLPKVTITVMSTYNLLSPFSYNDLINKIYEVKVKHQNQERYWAHAILLDTSYLRYPKHQSVKLLSNEHKELILKNAEEALYLGTPSFDRTNVGMTEVEITKIKRIYDWVISEPDEDFSQDKMDFISFVDEHDKRRGTNFLKTFPELTEFYNTIKNGN